MVLIIEPYSCVTDDILCVWTFGLPGLYNVIKIIIIIYLILPAVQGSTMEPGEEIARAKGSESGKL